MFEENGVEVLPALGGPDIGPTQHTTGTGAREAKASAALTHVDASRSTRTEYTRRNTNYRKKRTLLGPFAISLYQARAGGNELHPIARVRKEHAGAQTSFNTLHRFVVIDRKPPNAKIGIKAVSNVRRAREAKR